MSWEYAIDQMNVMKSSLKWGKVEEILDDEKRARRARQMKVMKERVALLKLGDNLFKYDRLGALHTRFYQIDPDEEVLTW